MEHFGLNDENLMRVYVKGDPFTKLPPGPFKQLGKAFELQAPRKEELELVIEKKKIPRWALNWLRFATTPLIAHLILNIDNSLKYLNDA